MRSGGSSIAAPAGSFECIFDDAVGVGRVDSLVLKTDPLSYGGRDRVIPLWPEEQGVTLSFGARFLRQGDLLVDLGVGSGVFGLAAASLSGCRVLGVDINPRALRFAKENAQKNNIPVARDVASVVAGEVCLLNKRVEPRLRKLLPNGGADVVVLNAPYHPTMPDTLPAEHAFAGLDGQLAYAQFIDAAAALISERGVIVLHHMSTRDRAGRLTAFDAAATALARRGLGGTCYWFSCLSEGRVKAGTLLHGIYDGLADEHALVRYTESVEARATSFEIVTAAIRVSRQTGFKAAKLIPRMMHGRTWSDRMDIHRAIAASALRLGAS